jgi:lipid-binding SYLF domain-containing protein
MNPSSSNRTRRAAAIALGVLALAACSSSSKTSSPETTAAKVESARAEALDRLDKSAQVTTDIRGKIPDDVASSAKCVVVFPSLVKAGVIIGGQGGKGFATCQNAGSWSAPAPISIGGGTLGAQIGAQSTELVALVESDRGKRALESGNFRVGVDASAAAGPVGTGRSSSTGATEGGDLVSYSHAKGLYAGANLDGTSITQDEDATRALYGSRHDLKSLLDGKVATPKDAPAQRFLDAARSGFGSGRLVSSLR